MRATLTLFSRGLAVSAAAVLITACTGDAQDDDSAASPTTSESPAPTSEAEEPEAAPQAGSAFCTQSQELLQGLGAAFTDQDPASVEGAFQQAAEGFRSVEAPSEIEDAWTTLGDGLQEYAAAFSDLDETDPESVADFQQRTSALQGGLTAAATDVETYLNEQCGIDTDQEEPTESAPTS